MEDPLHGREQVFEDSAGAEHPIEFGKDLREPGGIEITEAELESELKAVRAELREARARSS